MNKTVFLFVGPHRSGSTFLLGQIFPHVRNLCNMRSHDPACSDVVMEAMDEHPMFIDIDAYRERIYSRFDSIEEDNVLIGNEEFFGDYGKYISDGAYVAKPFYDNPQRVDLLAKLFDNPKIILTPRRQDLWVESAYMHFVHNSHTITVDAEIPEGGAEGVLVCLGGDTAGWTLYIREDGKLVYHYNWFDMERYEIVSDRAAPTGSVMLRCEFLNESQIPGGPATVSLLIDNKPVGQGRIEKQVRGRFGVESLDVGVDALTAVDKAYANKQPYWFTGTINTVRFDFGDSVELSPEERFEMFLKMD